MENSRNKVLTNWFKNIGETFKVLIADDEVDNDVPLYGELLADPIEAMKQSDVVASKEEVVKKVQTKTRARTTRAKMPKQDKTVESHEDIEL